VEAARSSHDHIDAEASLQTHAPKSLFFTDGSGYEGMIGASAVAPREAIFKRRHLGTSGQSTVYVAELSGIEMALEKFRTGQPRPQGELVIFSDSQAAIQAVQNPRRQSGQHVLCAIYDHVGAIQPPTSPSIVTIRWIPAHVGVYGNELADTEAKEAAKEGENNPDYLSSGGTRTGFGARLRLASTAKRQVRSRIKNEWAREWAKEKTGKPNQRLVKAPDKKNLRLFEGISKPYASILVQMRSMRIGLRHFLYKINAAESDRCSCGEGSQTPRHILLQCPLFTDLRRTLMDKVRAQTDLGNSTDYDAIVSHPQATRYVADSYYKQVS
jgi:tubulin alpha